MHVFVTGATGFVGRAVVRELLDNGHQVTGLARSERSARALQQVGSGALRGDLEDLAALRRGVDDADGVVHTAFENDFEHYAQSAERDHRAVVALAEALTGSDRPLVVTSVTSLLPAGRLGTEDDAADPAAPSAIRIPSEEAALTSASRGVRASVVRLPPSVHDGDSRGFTTFLAEAARRAGASAHVGDGSQRWPAVHRLDAARLFREALETGSAGSRFHAVDEQELTIGEIAQALGRELRLPVRSLSPDEAGGHIGALAPFLSYDNPVSSALTRQRLGWAPQHPGLLAEMKGAEDLRPEATATA